MNRFVAVDGESYTINDDHRYVLLAASTGDYEFDAKGLSTVRCLEFLLSLPRTAVKVGFGFNYDVNMILRDLDAETLIRLWHEQRVRWNQTYTLEWIPNKWFAVKSGKRRVKICDVFGFFQTSFVNALRKWGMEPGEEIESMKQQRSLFDPAMKADVIHYCLEECRLLVDLMDELEIALESVDLKLSSWVGAGSIASALMRREGVKNHVVADAEFGEEIYDAIRRAYFGGRSELFLQGEFPRLYDYDISSAYPAIAQTLPSLVDGKWQRRRKYGERYDHALWECSWSIPRDFPVMPFPYRASENRGDVFYPQNGRGWYHHAEVKAALELVGDRIKIHGGYTFHPGTDERPFDFIPRVYDYRAKLKADEHAGEKVLKLGLNSIYGKLAQGFGYKGKRPPFQSYFLAGAITAGTRARILDIVGYAPNDLVMVATDGIFFRRPIDANRLRGLGGLELTVMDDVFVAQPGVYSAMVEGDEFGRSRGFFSKEIDFADLRRGFKEHGNHYVGGYESTRFVGVGSALLLRSLDRWRTWSTSPRSLSLYPSRKFADASGGNPIRHYAPTVNGEISARYRPKSRGTPLDGDELETLVAYVQGTEQPLKDY